MVDKTKHDKKNNLKMPRGKKKLMIEALNNKLGNISGACKEVGISRETHYRWLRVDKNYNHFCIEGQELIKDFAETALLRRMKEGSDSSIQFYLKNKARDRGYIDKHEIEHSGESQPHTFNLIVKSVEEIKNEKPNNQPKAA